MHALITMMPTITQKYALTKTQLHLIVCVEFKVWITSTKNTLKNLWSDGEPYDFLHGDLKPMTSKVNGFVKNVASLKASDQYVIENWCIGKNC